MLSKAEAVKLTTCYMLYRRLHKSLIIVDKIDEKAYQYFPDAVFDDAKKLPKIAPCTHSTKWVLLMIIPAFIFLHLTKPFTPMCGDWQFKRFHFSCLSCRVRRVIIGDLPRLFHVELYEMYVYPERKFLRFKRRAFKALATLSEFNII